MDERPAIDRDLLIPILVGGLSIFGILVILLVGRLNAARAAVPTQPTETPFKYIYLGTEPGIFTGSPEVSETLEGPTTGPGGTAPVILTLPPATATRSPVPGTQNLTSPPEGPPDSIGTPPGGGPPGNTPFPTVTSAAPEPLTAGTYEDSDFRLIYEGPWEEGQGTHVSVALESTVTFRYIGKEWRLRYQSGPGLGVLSISVDGTVVDTLNESENTTQAREWVCTDCASLPNTTHTVVLRHQSGGSVNIDQVIIISVGTATPTPTRTPP